MQEPGITVARCQATNTFDFGHQAPRQFWEMIIEWLKDRYPGITTDNPVHGQDEHRHHRNQDGRSSTGSVTATAAEGGTALPGVAGYVAGSYWQQGRATNGTLVSQPMGSATNGTPVSQPMGGDGQGGTAAGQGARGGAAIGGCAIGEFSKGGRAFGGSVDGDDSEGGPAVGGQAYGCGAAAQGGDAIGGSTIRSHRNVKSGDAWAGNASDADDNPEKYQIWAIFQTVLRNGTWRFNKTSGRRGSDR